MPFNYCSMTLKVAENPYCSVELISDSDLTKLTVPTIKQVGIVFDILSIVPFIKQHGVNPITGS